MTSRAISVVVVLVAVLTAARQTKWGGFDFSALLRRRWAIIKEPMHGFGLRAILHRRRPQLKGEVATTTAISRRDYTEGFQDPENLRRETASAFEVSYTTSTLKKKKLL